MQYRTLGRTGIKVTPYALGAMMLGSLGNPDRAEGVRIIHRALDAGINFVDTADRYGDSEEVVGEALKGRRDEVVLATKFWGPVDDDINHRGALPPLDHGGRRALAAQPADRPHRSLPAAPARPGHRHRRDALRAHRPRAPGQGARDRHVVDARFRDRRGAVDVRAPRLRAIPHRAAELLDPRPRDRARDPAGRPALRDGHPRLQPARRRHADGPLPGRAGERQLPVDADGHASLPGRAPARRRRGARRALRRGRR